MNDLHERLFALLDERYRRIFHVVEDRYGHRVSAHGWQGPSFHDSIREWDEFLRQNGIEAIDAREEWRLCNGVARHIGWLLQRQKEIHFVSDPCYELGIRLGILAGNHRLLKMDDELAMRILALGLP